MKNKEEFQLIQNKIYEIRGRKVMIDFPKISCFKTHSIHIKQASRPLNEGRRGLPIKRINCLLFSYCNPVAIENGQTQFIHYIFDGQLCFYRITRAVNWRGKG